MRVATVIAALAAMASAAPAKQHNNGYGHCLTHADARELVYATTDIFTSNDPTDLVRKYFTKDYRQFTDSTIILFPEFGIPFGDPFTKSRKQFLQQHVGSNPDNPGYVVEDFFYNCEKIVFRFVSNQEVPVRGLEVLETVRVGSGSKGGFRIKTDYNEFNNVALLANFGICPGGPCPGAEEGAPAAAEK